MTLAGRNSGRAVAHTPLRIPFAGGLTDVQGYADRFGGATVSSAIDLGIRVQIGPSATGRYEISSVLGTETATRRSDIGNDLVREALRSVGHDGPPLAIAITADVADHSGLGASGATVVGLLHALRSLRGEHPEAAALAREACHIEVDVLGGASGYHDANICARGGLLLLEYRGVDAVAQQIELPAGFQTRFEQSLLLFGTGRATNHTRASLQRLGAGIGQALPVLHQMKALAFRTATALRAGDLPEVAHCIGEQQRLKQLLPGAFLDEFVLDVTARVAAVGARAQFPGGKIGAYLLVCCPDGQQDAVRRALSELVELPRLRFTRMGSRLLAG